MSASAPISKGSLVHVPRLLTAVTLAAVVAGLSATTLPALTSEAPFTAAAAEPGKGRPNIVLITTDDQTLRDMAHLPRTRRLLGRRGARFTQAINPHPLCCPARAEILTGQYAQNNGVRHNAGPFGGYQALRPRHTIGPWLKRAGYRTAFTGKFLNLYEGESNRPPGWTVWDATVGGVYNYFDFKTFNNGRPRRFRGEHSADVIGDRSAKYIRQLSGRRPFFLWASHVAPHRRRVAKGVWAPAEGARRHASMFRRAVAPSVKKPSFNEPAIGDKPEHLRDNAPISPRRMHADHRGRLRSLQAVDQAVARTVRVLRRTGELSSTLIVFTSDNGFLLGEHRMTGKDVPYEEALRVPLLVRGPGVRPGTVVRTPALTIDMAPTFLQLARARASVPMDGISLVGAMRRGRSVHRDTVLIQAGTKAPKELARSGWGYRGVRTSRYTFVRHDSGFAELYDRRNDPWQLRNVATRPRYREVRQELQGRTRRLKRCTGRTCRGTFGEVAGPRRPTPSPSPSPTPSPSPSPTPGDEASPSPTVGVVPGG